MAPKKTNDSTITPPLSLDDDEQDEDFVASENGSADSDGEASDSDESSESGSDADEEDEDDDPTAAAHHADLPADLLATLRQAIEGEKVLDEPILSDSEISREFPEEEDDVLGALAGSDFDSDEDEDATSGATGSEASAQEVRRAASTIAAAQSAAAAAAVAGEGGRVAGASPTVTTTRRRTRFGDEALSEQGVGPQLIPLSPPQARRNPSRTAGARPTSPPMEVFGAMLPSLEDINNNNDNDGATSRPIAQRTRAHVSLMDVTIEELEDKLGPATGTHEPLLYFGVDDAAEWERFIAGLQVSLDYGVAGGISGLGGDGLGTGGGAGTINGGTAPLGTAGLDTEFEDSDDEDFVVELERMLQEDETARIHHGFDMNLGISLPDDFFNYNAGGGGGGGGYGGGKQGKYFRGPRTRSGVRSRKRRKVEKPPRRSARLLNLNAEERPRFMASLIDRRTGKATAAALQQGIVDNNPALQQAYAPAIGAQASLLFAGLDELATLAAALATGPPIPLPSDMGKPGTEAATKTVVWRAPLPKAMRKYDLSAQPDESAPIVGAHFQASQYSDLYRSIHHHVQLLTQTTAMAAASGDAESAAAGARLLREMEEFVANQTNSRKASGIPAYVSACLGIDTGEGLEDDEEPAAAFGVASGSRQPAGGYINNRIWTPQNPGNIYTVADVSVLRAAPRMLELLPSGFGNILDDNIAPGGGGLPPVPTSSLELETRQRTHTTEVDKQKKRKRGKKPNEHPIWASLPADVALAVVPVKRFFDPGMEPMPPDFVATSQMMFTPAEDALLAWGIRKHLYDWARIAGELLPTKDEKVIFNRKKNRCSSAAPDNIVKDVVSLITGDLTLAEELLIVQALEFYGKQRKKWEVICKEHLPHRHPQVLSMLWSTRQKKIYAALHGEGGSGTVRMDAATVTAAAAAMPRANQGLVMNDDAAAAGGSGSGAAAEQLTLPEMIAQQQNYAATQQRAAAAIGAGLLPQINLNAAAAVAAATAAAAAVPPVSAGWMPDSHTLPPPPMQTQQQQQQHQQQISNSGTAAPGPGVAPQRLVEWQQPPGEEDIPEQQPKEAPPRNDASQIFDRLTGKAPAAAEPAVPAERPWSKDEEKAVLVATVSNKGILGEEHLQEFMATMKRNKEEIIALSEILLQRLREKGKGRQMPAGGGGGGA